MKTNAFVWTVLTCTLSALIPKVVVAEELNDQAYGVLSRYCIRCHGDDFRYPSLDLRDRNSLVKPRDADEEPFLVPANLETSRIWQVLSNQDPVQMPPEKQPQPTDEEKAIIKNWILAGAAFPVSTRPTRKFIGDKALVELIAADLDRQPVEQQSQLRYFTLAHLWNSPLTDEDLRITRAAISKLINSLSKRSRIVPPTIVDPEGVVLRINLLDYGWTDATHWLELLRSYPYGLTVETAIAKTIYARTKSSLPYIRGDWFAFHAARPPLYHTLSTLPERTGLPSDQRQLEEVLDVNFAENFSLGRLRRAGLSGEKSGVSDHWRIVERQESKYGYYWGSYDSADDSGRHNFPKFPLGPKLPDSSSEGAFEHDGGEFIFSLPNGLQGYLLAKANGERLDAGPLQIVSDPNQFSGSNTIVNGISCMGCHRQGLVPFRDSVRSVYEKRNTEVAEKVLQIYPTHADFEPLIASDRAKFLAALDAAIGPFLRAGAANPRAVNVEDFVEPITAAARRYDRPMRLRDVATDLGLPKERGDAEKYRIQITEEELPAAIRLSSVLRKAELEPLLSDDSITRKQFETIYQRVARELELGIPLDVQ